MKLSLVLKSFVIIVLLVQNISHLLSQDLIKGGFTTCQVLAYEYINGKIDSSSAKINKFIKYDSAGLKVQEESYFQNVLSYIDYFYYDSLDQIILNKRVYTYSDDNYKIEYKYGPKGNITEIYAYNSGDTLMSFQKLLYNEQGQKTEQQYYREPQSAAHVIEYFKYNEKGLIIEKKTSSFRDCIMDTYEYYKYDSNDLLIEINIEQVPELISRQDVLYWAKDELGYHQGISVPLPSFDKKINFYYDADGRLIMKKRDLGDNSPISIEKYYYDDFGNLAYSINSGDYSRIEESFKSNNLGDVYKQIAPIHFKSHDGRPSRKIQYNYSK